MFTKLSKRNIISVFFGISIVFIALSDILNSSLLYIIASLISVLSIIFSNPKNYLLQYFVILSFLLALIFFSLVNIFFTKNGIGGSFFLFGNILFAFLYFNVDKKKITIWIFMSYFITLGFIVYRLFVLKIHPNYIYEGASQNHGGFVVTFWSIFLLFHLRLTYKYISILVPFIGLFMAVILIGRTSMAVFLILFLICVYYKFKGGKKYFIPLFTLLLIISIGYLWNEYKDFILLETNLKEGLYTTRYKIWAAYINNIDVLNLFTGVDVSTIHVIHVHSDNPHNSFLKFHSRVGFGAILFFFLLFSAIFLYIRKKRFFFLSLLILLSLRAFFDSDILIGKFDFIYLIIFFYSFYFTKNRINRNKLIYQN